MVFLFPLRNYFLLLSCLFGCNILLLLFILKIVLLHTLLPSQYFWSCTLIFSMEMFWYSIFKQFSNIFCPYFQFLFGISNKLSVSIFYCTCLLFSMYSSYFFYLSTYIKAIIFPFMRIVWYIVYPLDLISFYGWF